MPEAAAVIIPLLAVAASGYQMSQQQQQMHDMKKAGKDAQTAENAKISEMEKTKKAQDIQAAQTSQQLSRENALKAIGMGFGGTQTSGPQGVTTQANTGQKSLLGI